MEWLKWFSERVKLSPQINNHIIETLNRMTHDVSKSWSAGGKDGQGQNIPLSEQYWVAAVRGIHCFRYINSQLSGTQASSLRTKGTVFAPFYQWDPSAGDDYQLLSQLICISVNFDLKSHMKVGFPRLFLKRTISYPDLVECVIYIRAKSSCRTKMDINQKERRILVFSSLDFWQVSPMVPRSHSFCCCTCSASLFPMPAI